MKKHISFNGLTLSPTDHEAHEGDLALSVNLIHEDEALRPIALTAEHTGILLAGLLSSGAKLLFAHQGRMIVGPAAASCLPKTTPDDAAASTAEYWWVDSHDAGSSPRRLYAGQVIRAFAAVGDTLCMTTDTQTLYALWQEERSDYLVVTHDDLRYDLTITQDSQARIEVERDLSPALAKLLDAPDEALSGRPALPGRVFPGFYDADTTYATGASMVAAQMEVALDQEMGRRGIGTMKHIVIGMTAIRLKDGSRLMYSNPFALWPADQPTAITADRERAKLRMTAYLHRHALSFSCRHAESGIWQLVDGVDVLLSQPLNFLDMHKAAAHTTDSEGRITSLSFAPDDRQDVSDILKHLKLYHAITLSIDQQNSPISIPLAATTEAADTQDLRRTTTGAMSAYAHGGRLHLAATTTVLHHPMEIGIRYTYRTLDAVARHSLPANRLEELRSELTAGSRADIGDLAGGQEAELVMRVFSDDPATGEMWWKGSVPYPIPGMMMVPHRHAGEAEWHLKRNVGGQDRYYKLRQRLQPCENIGMAVAVYTATGQAHLSQRPAVLSLLLQQVEALAYDEESATYEAAYPIWQEESAEEYEAQARRASDCWPLRCETARLRTSLAGNPMVFPSESTVNVGGTLLHGIISNTRRTADGLYGDGQYYAFTDEGVWLLRLSGGKWHAQQAVTRIPPLSIGQVKCTSDAVAYLSDQGLMLLKGSTASCLSEPLHGPRFNPSCLPRFRDILATETAFAADCDQESTAADDHEGTADILPCEMWSFLHRARIIYEPRRDRLLLCNTTTDSDGRQRWPQILVRSMRSGAWGTADIAVGSIVVDDSDGGSIWALCHKSGSPSHGESDGEELMRLTCSCHIRQPFVMCTRPMPITDRHTLKTVTSLIVRGLFLHRGGKSSHVGVALWGSNDLHHWHLIGTCADQYMRRHRGTPFKWFRLAAIGQLLPTESIEGVTLIATAATSPRTVLL